MRLVYTESARRELHEVTRFYARQDRRVAISFVEEFDRALALLLENPKLGHRVSPKVRRLSVQKYPYSIYYTLDVARDEITLSVVCHQRRSPRYWQGRVREPTVGYEVLRAA